MPEISIILPVYNAASYVGEALDSLLNQTFTDFEILVLNDGSTDNSEQVILGFKDDRIRYIPSERNQGLIYQLNLGMKEANGTYIVRLDADDVANPERLSIQYRYMQENPEVVLCGSYASVLGDETKTLKHATADEDIRIELLQHNAFIHSTVIYRKDIIKKYNLLFDEQFKHAEDYYMWVLMARYGKIANIPHMLIQYRIHEQQVTEQHKEVQQYHADDIRILQISWLLGRSPSKEEEQVHLGLLYPAQVTQPTAMVYAWFQRLMLANKNNGVYNPEKFSAWLNQKYTTWLRHRFLWTKQKNKIKDLFDSRVLWNSNFSLKEKLSLIKNNMVL